MSLPGSPPAFAYHAAVGFNPFRAHQRDAADIAMVVVAVLVTLAVLAWAIWG